LTATILKEIHVRLLHSIKPRGGHGGRSVPGEQDFEPFTRIRLATGRIGSTLYGDLIICGGRQAWESVGSGYETNLRPLAQRGRCREKRRVRAAALEVYTCAES
jgi:hypothetical protein